MARFTQKMQLFDSSIYINIFFKERERLKTSYSTQHDLKITKRGSCHGQRHQVKASSLGLLCGTNEDAEDLTGQRAPLASSRSDLKYVEQVLEQEQSSSR